MRTRFTAMSLSPLIDIVNTLFILYTVDEGRMEGRVGVGDGVGAAIVTRRQLQRNYQNIYIF